MCKSSLGVLGINCFSFSFKSFSALVSFANPSFHSLAARYNYTGRLPAKSALSQAHLKGGKKDIKRQRGNEISEEASSS